jgi:hypothetical protein
MKTLGIDITTYPIPAHGAVGRLVEEGAVVVIPETGKVQGLNELGARIWMLSDGSLTVNEIVEGISGEYDAGRARVETDTAAF